jgi:hypothetical protein
MSNIKRVRWFSQPQGPVSISNVYSQYSPKLVLLPATRVQNLGFLTLPVTIANDANVGANSFNFPGVDGFVGFGTDTTTPQDSYTILAVAKTVAFVATTPRIASFITSGTRQVCVFSSLATFLDMSIGRAAATAAQAARFAFPTSEPVLNTTRNIVVKKNGGDLTASWTAWANGESLVRSAPGGTFAADPGGGSVIGITSSTTLTNEFVGNVYLFALFNSALPDEYCLRLSINPWQLFAPIPAKMLDAPSGVLPPAFIPWWASQRSRTIGAGAGLN